MITNPRGRSDNDDDDDDDDDHSRRHHDHHRRQTTTTTLELRIDVPDVHTYIWHNSSVKVGTLKVPINIGNAWQFDAVGTSDFRMKEPYRNPLNPAPTRFYFQNPSGSVTFYTLMKTEEMTDTQRVWQIFTGQCPKKCGKLRYRLEASPGQTWKVYPLVSSSWGGDEVASARVVDQSDANTQKTIEVRVHEGIDSAMISSFVSAVHFHMETEDDQ